MRTFILFTYRIFPLNAIIELGYWWEGHGVVLRKGGDHLTTLDALIAVVRLCGTYEFMVWNP